MLVYVVDGLRSFSEPELGVREGGRWWCVEYVTLMPQGATNINIYFLSLAQILFATMHQAFNHSSCVQAKHYLQLFLAGVECFGFWGSNVAGPVVEGGVELLVLQIVATKMAVSSSKSSQPALFQCWCRRWFTQEIFWNRNWTSWKEGGRRIMQRVCHDNAALLFRVMLPAFFLADWLWN